MYDQDKSFNDGHGIRKQIVVTYNVLRTTDLFGKIKIKKKREKGGGQRNVHN